MPSIPIGGPERTFDSRVEEIVRRIVRQEAARLVGAQSAEADAQNAGGGLGIQNIRRGRARAEIVQSSNITVTAGSAGVFNALSTPLTADIVLSGRPLAIFVTGKAYGAGGDFCLDVNLRGEQISDDRNSGMVGTYLSGLGGAAGFTGFDVVGAPLPGPARLEVVAACTSVNWTIYVGTGDNALILNAVEL